MSVVSKLLAMHSVPHVQVTAQWNFELTDRQRSRMLSVAAQLESLVREFRDAMRTASKTVFPRVVNEIIAALEWYQDNTDISSIEQDLQYLKAVATSFDRGANSHHGLNYSYVHSDLTQVMCRLKHLVCDTYNYLAQTRC